MMDPNTHSLELFMYCRYIYLQTLKVPLIYLSSLLFQSRPPQTPNLLICTSTGVRVLVVKLWCLAREGIRSISSKGLNHIYIYRNKRISEAIGNIERFVTSKLGVWVGWLPRWSEPHMNMVRVCLKRIIRWWEKEPHFVMRTCFTYVYVEYLQVISNSGARYNIHMYVLLSYTNSQVPPR